MAPVFVMIAVTGILLLVKKDFDWLQPPTQKGAESDLAAAPFLPLAVIFDIASEFEHFRTIDDIDRIDFRPGKRVHKLRSKHDHWELQIDAVTGTVLSRERRRSDLIEQIHDGSFFADIVHGWVMPGVAIALVLMAVTGIYIWWFPIQTRRRRRRARAQVD